MLCGCCEPLCLPGLVLCLSRSLRQAKRLGRKVSLGPRGPTDAGTEQLGKAQPSAFPSLHPLHPLLTGSPHAGTCKPVQVTARATRGSATNVPGLSPCHGPMWQGVGGRINGSSILQANCIPNRLLELNATRRWVIYGVNCRKTAARRYGRGNKLKPSVTKPITGKGGVERWKQGGEDIYFQLRYESSGESMTGT